MLNKTFLLIAFYLLIFNYCNGQSYEIIGRFLDYESRKVTDSIKFYSESVLGQEIDIKKDGYFKFEYLTGKDSLKIYTDFPYCEIVIYGMNELKFNKKSFGNVFLLSKHEGGTKKNNIYVNKPKKILGLPIKKKRTLVDTLKSGYKNYGKLLINDKSDCGEDNYEVNIKEGIVYISASDLIKKACDKE